MTSAAVRGRIPGRPRTAGPTRTLRLLRVVALALLTAMTTAPSAAAAAPCHDCATGLPSGIPALSVLAPTSSTTVVAGGTVTLQAGFVQVGVQPFADLYYRGPGETIDSIRFDTDASPFAITVPSQWRPGKYRLVKVVTTALGVGTQYRNHRVVGTTTDTPSRTVCGRSDLDLRLLDLRVTAP